VSFSFGSLPSTIPTTFLLSWVDRTSNVLSTLTVTLTLLSVNGGSASPFSALARSSSNLVGAALKRKR
jgi:hypothetical protein